MGATCVARIGEDGFQRSTSHSHGRCSRYGIISGLRLG
jgi:hypothetical protein